MIKVFNPFLDEFDVEVFSLEDSNSDWKSPSAAIYLISLVNAAHVSAQLSSPRSPLITISDLSVDSGSIRIIISIKRPRTNLT